MGSPLFEALLYHAGEGWAAASASRYLKMWTLPFRQIWGAQGSQAELLGDRGIPRAPAHLGGGELERVVVRQEHLEVPEPPEAARDHDHPVAGEIQPDQG